MRKLYSEEAEQSVLGALLIEPNLIDDVAGLLTPQSFGIPAHGEIFATITTMRQAGKPTDTVTVAEALGDNAEFGFEYLVDMAGNVPSTRTAMTYAHAVLDRAKEREVFLTAQRVQSLIMEPGMDCAERLSQAQALFTGMVCEHKASTRAELDAVLERVVDAVQRRHDGEEDKDKILTGYADIDKRIAGFRPGDFVLIGARPGMGKTTYGMGVISHCIRHCGKALVFSMEMPAEQLAERLIASAGGAEMDFIRNPERAAKDVSFWDRFSTGVRLNKQLPLVIDDQGGLSISELQARARREHRISPVKMILVDYLQLMNAGRHIGKDNRNLEITAISQGLKNLAKELKCPVIALSQLNRNLETRPNKRPNNSDLRDSGSLEQDADVIQFLYRDDYYDENSPFKGVCEVITSKFRGGEPGTDRLHFEGRYNRFLDLDAQRFAEQQDAHQSANAQRNYKYGRKSA